MADLSVKSLLEAYTSMRLIRSFEEEVVRLVNANEIAGVTHEYVGEEAVAVGVCSVLEEQDIITSTHRGHGHLLARGADPQAMFAELMGRQAGLNKGRGGSMHAADLSIGIFGANGMVAGGVPWAAGAASAPTGDGRQRVAVAFFGDGALNQGVLLETLNLAAVWHIPLVFCCENNGYAVSTPTTTTTATSACQRATGFGVESREVDGMDVVAVTEAASWAVTAARRERRPIFLDCKCYRFVGHHTAERTMGLSYRSDDEIDKWRVRDPLVVVAQRLAALTDDAGRLTTERDAFVAAVISRAVIAARESESPDPASALDFAYATDLSGLPRGTTE